jgi:hypothetical protein
MVASAIHKRKTLFFIFFLVAFFTFTADIIDLREELHILSCPNSTLDSNVTAAIISTDVTLLPELLNIICTVQKKSSVKISFLHLLPFTFRAPPSLFS